VPPAPRPAGTLLGFDFGTRRIGVAVATTITRQASPLTTIEIADERARLEAIATLVREWSPSQIVVGVPVHADGATHAITAKARAFAATLARRFKLPVAEVDERYTTEIAQQVLDESELPRRRHRSVRDQVAAQLILQGFLDDPGTA
jgi:putative Holliday junction resolvase